MTFEYFTCIHLLLCDWTQLPANESLIAEADNMEAIKHCVVIGSEIRCISVFNPG